MLDVEIFKTDPDGLQECIVSINKSYQAISTICFEIKHQAGAYGGSAFPEPVKLNCGRGIIRTGDWSQMGVLKSYSGGMWYRKKIHLECLPDQGKKGIEVGLETVELAPDYHTLF